MSETNVTTNPAIITRDQYRDTLQRLWSHVRNELAPRKGWCDQWAVTMYRVSHDFPSRAYETMVPMPFSAPHTNPSSDCRACNGYARDLADIRGRIAWLVNRTNRVGLADANAALLAAGMEPLDDTPPAEPEVTYTFAYTLTGIASITTDEDQAWARGEVIAALEASSNNYQVSIDSGDVDSLYLDNVSSDDDSADYGTVPDSVQIVPLLAE